MRIPPQEGTHFVSSRCHMSLGTFTDRPELLEHKPYSTEHQTLRPQIYDLPPGGPRALSQPHMFSISRGSEKQRGGHFDFLGIPAPHHSLIAHVAFQNKRPSVEPTWA